MVLPTEQDIRKKYRSLPEPIQGILNSPVYSDEIREINKKHDLNKEDSRILTAAVGLVFLGFIKPQELFQEINDYLEADEKVVTEVIREINRQIFIPLHKELESLYKLKTHIEDELEKERVEPVVEIKPKTEKPPVLERFGEEAPTPVRIEVETKKPTVAPPAAEAKAGEESKSFDATQGKPLIIHREETQKPATEDKKFKGFEFPFGIFDKEGNKAISQEPVRVRVETPGQEKPLDKARGKRVVHYSEYRTPITPFGKPEEEIIAIKKEPPPTENKSTFPWPKPELKPEPPKPPAPPPRPEPKPELKAEKKGPSIEGNIIDLKNL